MALGNEIIVSNEPRGRFAEGTISGTPKPGTVMQLKGGVEPVGGRFTYEVYAPGTDGDRPEGALWVLLPDQNQGKIATDAYVSGTRGFLYAPMHGDELNMLLKNISGTSDAFAIGDKFTVDTGTGKLIQTTGDPEIEPYVCLETTAGITADTLVRCIFTGY